MNPPRIVVLCREGATLDDVQAVAGKLWLNTPAAALEDVDGAVNKAIAAYWAALPGPDPYWDALAARMTCDACGESSKLENLSVCPNCFSAFCYRHGRNCPCGGETLG
ncbi:MAG: hypothetical protein GC189_04445 [Alphaproteobacteria bacterium]|nr:hypothetical protein [Alphaproteobacteria bacterium]